jgi:hypothetical protein
LVVPVPLSAARVGRLGAVGGREGADAVREVVALEAARAGTRIGVGLAEVLYGHTELLEGATGKAEAFEDESLRALETDLIVPVPLGTGKVEGGGGVGGGKNAGTVLQVVALETGQTFSVDVVGTALVTDRHADIFIVEDPTLRAHETHLVVPVPLSAAGVSGLGAVGGRKGANSILEVVALEAGQTETSGIVGFALIADGYADLFVVEDPTVGASKADLIVPVPDRASYIGRLGAVGGRKRANSVLEVVALETGQTLSVGISSMTEITDRHTLSLSIEVPHF